MHSPRQHHLDAVYRVLRYRKQTPGRGLFFTNNDDRNVSAFTDADWAGSVDYRKSTTGTAQKFGEIL